MKKYKSKVAIIGSGLVGSSAAFCFTISSLAAEVVLIDVNKEKAIGEVLDINHGMSYLKQTNVFAGDFSDIKDSDVIIITAGSNRKPGESRLDLACKNKGIIENITDEIMKHYNTGVILTVTNPVDIYTYIIQKRSGLPASNVIGTGTTLDTSRFRYKIGDMFGVNISNVHGYILGEHGDSQFPAWSTVNIAGMPIAEYAKTYNMALDKEMIYEEIKNSGAEVIKRKGATYYAIALSITRIVESILKNQKSILPVSSVISNKYGIDDIALSLPAVITHSGIEKILDLKYTNEELQCLTNSANQLKNFLNSINNN